MKEATDEALIESTLSGNDSAFAILIQRHQALVATTAMSMLGDSNDAEEAGQETFIRLYRSLHRFKGESKLSTYVNRICINVCLNALKKRRTFISRFLGVESIQDLDTENDLGKQLEEKELIQMAMMHLVPDQRTVVTLRMIEGYSTYETSEILGIPEGTVLSRLKRGLDKLKRILIEVYNYED